MIHIGRGIDASVQNQGDNVSKIFNEPLDSPREDEHVNCSTDGQSGLFGARYQTLLEANVERQPLNALFPEQAFAETVIKEGNGHQDCAEHQTGQDSIRGRNFRRVES
jgi:hypothetical protein